MAKAFTTDYEHFADVKIGLLPYLAESTKEIFHNDDSDQLRKFMEDIAFVADNLYDLLDEIEASKIQYDQYRNRIAAIERDKAEKENALAAIKAEMQQKFGTAQDDVSVPELVFDSPDGTKVVTIPDKPEEDEMSAEDKAFMDAMLTFENVVDTSVMPPDENELLRESGLVFNDEIDQIAEERDNLDYDFEDDDEGLYNDFVDEYSEDIDEGYVPLDVPVLPADDEPEASPPPLASADAVFADDIDLFDVDFANAGQGDEYDANEETDDEVISDFFGDEDEIMNMFLDNDFANGEESGDDSNDDEMPPSTPIEDDDDDIMPTGFVDPSFL